MTRSRSLLGLVALTALPAAASAQPIASAPPTPVEAPATAPPASTPPRVASSPAPAAPRRDVGPGAPVRTAAFGWASPSRARLAARGLWDRGDDLSRDATRRDLARALMSLKPGAAGPLPSDVAAQDPAAGPIAAVVRRGWLTTSSGAFRPDAPVSARFAATVMLRAMGLGPSLRGLARVATEDGARLRVPAGFGPAVLSRELGLRHNYPAALDGAERADASPMRAADLVAMADRAGALSFAARSRAARFASIRLPVMGDAQRTVVEAAFAQAGMPYVWGGDWPTSASPWGAQAQGGFDCSGLVWMAFKGAPSSAALGAGTDLRGRTADAMAFETPSQRVALSVLAPGDLVFFGDAGLRTRRGAVSHVGIALGNGWMVHSSGSRAGVAISPLDSYWASGQARARRPGVFGAPPALTSAEKRGLAR